MQSRGNLKLNGSCLDDLIFLTYFLLIYPTDVQRLLFYINTFHRTNVMENIVNTPVCPICLKNYNCKVVPKILYPCGHGMCNKCLHDFRAHAMDTDGTIDELKCPTCREIIVHDFENYDLQGITSDVDHSTMPYWSKRLLEAIDTRGEIVDIDEKVLPFCRCLFTRIVYSEDIKTLGQIKTENWSECDRHKINSVISAFTQALTQSRVEVDEALDWITVLNMPQRVEVKLLQSVNKYYTTKNFLKSRNALWLMDTLFE